MTTDIMPIVKIAETGEPMADSRDVAAYFGKNHFDVLKAIRNLNCSRGFRDSNFAAFKIKDLTGESTSHVMMTKDGFTFLAMGFTGEGAATFKERYIAAFNAMAARPAVPDFSDPEVLQMHLLASTKIKVMQADVNAFARLWKGPALRKRSDRASGVTGQRTHRPR